MILWDMKISLILPVYNEETVLHEVLAKYIKELKTISEEYEVIAVNDGCTDGSFDILLSAGKLNRNLKIINFDARYGKQAAITAGMEAAKGDVVILADIDITNPVGVLKKVVDEYKKGALIVHAKREVSRSARIKMRASDKTVYLGTKLFGVRGNYVGKVNISLYARTVADVIVALPDKNKYLRTMENWVGWDVSTIVYASGYNKAEEKMKLQQSEKKLKQQGKQPALRDKTREHTSSIIYAWACLALSVIVLFVGVTFALLGGFSVVVLPFSAHLMAWLLFLLLLMVTLMFALRAVLIKRIGIIHSKYKQKIYVIKSVIN